MMTHNPLLAAMSRIQLRIDGYRGRARDFYYEAMLSTRYCPRCDGGLVPAGPSRARCIACGHQIDPTVAFQRSHCCDARLTFKRSHYGCRECGKAVVSRFLFDERLFDQSYFKARMAESRERRRIRREELKRLLAGTRSNELSLAEFPDKGAIEDLARDLDRCVKTGPSGDLDQFLTQDEFHMEEYRQIILSRLDGCMVRFSAFPAIAKDPRMDCVRRFITLIFMEQAREVWLESRDNEIMVMPYGAND